MKRWMLIHECDSVMYNVVHKGNCVENIGQFTKINNHLQVIVS